MDIRTLRYFRAVARAGSITRAAEELHVSQPALSRQIIELERELGQRLFDRTGRRITLTDRGSLLLNRAQEILQLFDKTVAEVESPATVGGEVHIGCSETPTVASLAQAAVRLRHSNPDIVLHLHSEDSDRVTENLEHGLYDFGIMVGPARTDLFHALRLPQENRWGVLTCRDSPLAVHSSVDADTLRDTPLILPSKQIARERFYDWMGCAPNEEPRPVAVYNLLYNASLLVREGLGSAVSIDGIVATGSETGLAFRPLDPPLTSPVDLVWSRTHRLSPAGEAVLAAMRDITAQGTR